MGRAPCCDKANVKKGPWSPEEDSKLKAYIEQNGTGGNWIALPQRIGLKRCGKSCRLRWLNYLRPNIKHGGFSEEEDNIICSLYVSIGSRWSIIAAQLPGRTDNDIKNYWNTRLKKKLLGKQRKQQEAQAHKANNNTMIKQELTERHTDNNLVLMNQTANPPLSTLYQTTCASSSIQEPYDVNNLRNPLYECDPFFFPQDQLFPVINDCSTSKNVFEGFQVQNLLPSNNDLMSQMGCNVNTTLQKDGFQSYSGGGVMESSSTGTTSTESSSWADLSFFLNYSPDNMVSKYQEIMMPQEYVNAFQEPSFFGCNNISSVHDMV
ncbi:hypothetical protein QN277_003367 [Acacia crassicarpa]|uniref:Uncharacterized protein n=1 Tax=Acacia crassicarpa TaxID=499986 RepID=A0AAE1IZA8_9FABA|nr:hypothetical protein QN277_003367 [Acacia crassicarpa]